jgi:hypothetical protein
MFILSGLGQALKGAKEIGGSETDTTFVLLAGKGKKFCIIINRGPPFL